MIFSYGFIEEKMESARDLFIDLVISDYDPLKPAKKAVSNCPPGIRLISEVGGVRWEGDYVWIICVNEEDGLHFKVAQTTGGERELHVSWKDQDLTDTSKLKSFLEADELWDVYQLRAVSVIQDRIEQQLRILQTTGILHEIEPGKGTELRDGPWTLSLNLKLLEVDLLDQAFAHFEHQVRPDLIAMGYTRKWKVLHVTISLPSR